MTIRLLTVNIKTELDVVNARQRARQIASICGFPNREQVSIATAVSELARNIYNYAGHGNIYFAIEGTTAPQVLVVRIEDKGPGIAHIDTVLSGNYQSPTGMGKGLIGAQRLMDRFYIETAAGAGTKITLQKLFPMDAGVITAADAGKLFADLSFATSESTLDEVLQQNQELLTTLAELNARQEELIQLTRELEDTNRGMVALYAELDEKADHLRRADEMKSRFLSNTSHEFRTPLSSIRALSKLLLDRCDGDLTPEQEKQVRFIQESARNLSELVNDLLDLAKIESGKVDLHPEKCNVADMFSALRGMLRPLLVSESLQLNFLEPEQPINLFTDEMKLSQILRNFISNALKFTERGAITIDAEVIPATNMVRFNVADTGVGIAHDDLQIIFEEFGQVQNPLQRRVKGTGLGLPLCRKLANLLQGDVTVSSTLGVGSTFSVTIPQTLSVEEEKPTLIRHEPAVADSRLPVLVVEDDSATVALYEKYLQDSEFRLVHARNLREASELWTLVNPAVVVLDIHLRTENSWAWLAQLKNHRRLRQVPVVVASEVDDRHKGLSLGADAYFLKPLFRQQLLTCLRQLTESKYSEHHDELLPN